MKRTVRERWVVKVGSGTLVQGGPALMQSFMRQIARLRSEHDIDVVWVTSGAIATALEVLERPKTQADFTEKQALVAVGQPVIMHRYNEALRTAGLVGSQVLITYHDMCRASLRANLRAMMDLLLAWEVVPIVNENDIAIRKEKRFKDNDGLSAILARILGARRLILCTDVEGLYDADPRGNPRAKVIRRLRGVSPATLRKVEKGAGSLVSAGGMHSKLLAAREATSRGIETWLVRGETPNVLLKIASGKKVGTQITAPAEKAR